MKETSEKRFKFWPYFARYKISITFYILIMLLQVAIDLFFAIFIAGIIETVTQGLYLLAIQKFILLFIINASCNILSFSQDLIGYRVSKNVINNIFLNYSCA